jgi:hypothetical protein
MPKKVDQEDITFKAILREFINHITELRIHMDSKFDEIDIEIAKINGRIDQKFDDLVFRIDQVDNQIKERKHAKHHRSKRNYR